jgi:hypothetical protein
VRNNSPAGEVGVPVEWQFECGSFEEIAVGTISKGSADDLFDGAAFPEVLERELGPYPWEVVEHPARFLGSTPREVLSHGGPCRLMVGGADRAFADTEILVVAVDDEPISLRSAGRWKHRCCRLSDLERLVADDQLRASLSDSLAGDASVLQGRRRLFSVPDSYVWMSRIGWKGWNACRILTSSADSQVLLVFGYTRSLLLPFDPYDRRPTARSARSLGWSGVYLAGLAIGDQFFDWFEADEGSDRWWYWFLFGKTRRNTLELML